MEAGSETGKAVSATEERFGGILMVVVGLALAYWQVILPIMKATRGEASIDYDLRGIFFTPLFILLGIFVILFGGQKPGLLKIRPSKAGLIAFWIFVVVLTAACFIGMQLIMKGLGYS